MSLNSHNIIMILLIIIILLLVFLIIFFGVIFASKYLRSKKAKFKDSEIIFKNKKVKKRHKDSEKKYLKNFFQTSPQALNNKKDYFETVDLRTTAGDTGFDILSESSESSTFLSENNLHNDKNDSLDVTRDFKKNLYNIKKKMEDK